MLDKSLQLSRKAVLYCIYFNSVLQIVAINYNRQRFNAKYLADSKDAFKAFLTIKN